MFSAPVVFNLINILSMQCLVDFVGLRPCNYIPSQSGMYVDQLPGISIPDIDGIANEEQVTWQGVWNDLQATAKDTFREDIIQEFNKRWELKQITQTVDFGKKIDTTKTTVPVAGHQYGMILETKLPNSQCACSNLQKLYVQQLSFYWQGANPAPTFTVTFVDADLQTTLLTKVVGVGTAVAGWNDVWIDTEFDARRMYVFVSGNFDSYAQLDISQFFLGNFGTSYAFGFGYNNASNWWWVNWGGCGCQSRVQGVDYTNASNTASNPANTFGLSLVFSTKCSYDSVVCANKKHFASAWQHCLAIELLNYRLNSSRLNRWTTIDKKQAQELQAMLSTKYRGGTDPKTGIEYPGKLFSAINSIVLNDSDCCLRNNAPYNWRETRT